MYGKSNVETYITIGKIEADGSLLYGSGNSNREGLCINLEVWDWEGDGREVRGRGDICIPMADSC